MAVISTNRIAGPFVGNSATVAFPFSFKVFAASDLFLLVVDGNGISTVLVLNTDYTAVLNDNQDTSPGGTVTLTAALATGERMTITSSVAGLQEVVLTNLGGFFPTVLNAVFDRLTILNQQVQQGVNQSLKFGLTDDLSSVELPPAIARAGTFLTFDESGAAAIIPLLGGPIDYVTAAFTATATLLPSGAAPTAALSGSDGEYALEIGVPVGASGLDGAPGAPANPRGAYLAGTIYAKGDGVIFGGAYYVGLVDANEGHQPDTSPAQWLLASLQGANGTNGIVTVNGPITGDVFASGNFIGGQTYESASDIEVLAGAQNGDILLGVDRSTGKLVGVNGLPASASTQGDDLYLAGRMLDSQVFYTAPTAKPGIYFGAANGDIAFAIFGDGSTTSRAATATSAPPAASYYSRADGTGKMQVFQVMVGQGEVQLTTSGNNTFTGTTKDQQTVFFTSDRDGSSAAYYMTRSGLHQLPVTIDIANACALNGQATTGQSLSVGDVGQPALSTIQPCQNLTFNIGPRLVDNSDAGSAVLAASIDHFVPAVEINSASDNAGETIAGGASTTTAEMLRQGYRYTALSFINGQGSQPYTTLNKGSTNYENGIAAITRAMALYQAAGFASFGVRDYGIVHGEADEQAQTANYGADMLQWFNDYNADIKAITDQRLDVPHLHSQMSSGYVWSNTNIIPQQQLDACQNNPGKLIMVCPKYFLQYNLANPHLTNYGYQMLGEYYGRVRALNARGIEWVPFWPTSIVRWGSASPEVLVKFNVPVAPIVFDTVLVTEPTSITGQMYGFEGYDGGATPTILSVLPDSENGSDLRITFNRPLAAAARLRYAFSRPTQNGQAGIAGPTGDYAGNRGNVRDSTLGLSINGNNQYNWLCQFDKSIG